MVPVTNMRYESGSQARTINLSSFQFPESNKLRARGRYWRGLPAVWQFSSRREAILEWPG